MFQSLAVPRVGKLGEVEQGLRRRLQEGDCQLKLGGLEQLIDLR